MKEDLNPIGKACRKFRKQLNKIGYTTSNIIILEVGPCKNDIAFKVEVHKIKGK